MSIDPRIMKQLLQLELSRNLNTMTSSTQGAGGLNDDTSSTFSMMLENLLGQASSASQEPTGNRLPALPAVRPALHVNPPLSMSRPSAYDPLVQVASNEFGVASSLIKAVIDAESSFNASAVSSAGAKGLMQLMDATAKGLGVTDSFDPQQNIRGGTQFLSDLLQKYKGNEGVALAAYNAGPGRIDRLGITNDAELRAKYDSLPQETKRYINKVLEKKQGYEV